MVEVKRYTECDRTWSVQEDSDGRWYKFRVAYDNEGNEMFVASETIYNHIMPDGEYNRNISAEEVDNAICFYVSDDDIRLKDEELAELLKAECPEVFY